MAIHEIEVHKQAFVKLPKRVSPGDKIRFKKHRGRKHHVGVTLPCGLFTLSTDGHHLVVVASSGTYTISAPKEGTSQEPHASGGGSQPPPVFTGTITVQGPAGED